MYKFFVCNHPVSSFLILFFFYIYLFIFFLREVVKSFYDQATVRSLVKHWELFAISFSLSCLCTKEMKLLFFLLSRSQVHTHTHVCNINDYFLLITTPLLTHSQTGISTSIYTFITSSPLKRTHEGTHILLPCTNIHKKDTLTWQEEQQQKDRKKKSRL